MAYVDGFVLPVRVKNLSAYRRLAQQGARIWREHGALEYHECIGDDLDVKMGTPFARQLGLKRGETVAFSWIVYRSRAHRDQVNARVMKDPRMASMDPKDMPFDVKRMCYGGFRTIVDFAAGSSRARRRPARRAAPEMRPGAAEHAAAEP